MPTFQSNPVSHGRWNQVFRKNPALFGVPFVLIVVGASFGMTTFTSTRYELQKQRTTTMTKDDEQLLKKRKKKFDIREEYYRLQAKGTEEWEPKRIERPEGVAEWGVPPEGK